MGFAISRRIMAAANIKRHEINALLVLVAINERHRRLTTGLWAEYLDETLTPDQRAGTEAPPSQDNWSEAARFTTHPATAAPAYGLTFIPPRVAHEPWVIKTQWTAKEFMKILRRIRPSNQSLRWLTDYADVFVRTRHAEGPVPGLQIEGMPRGRMYTAPFTTAPSVQHTFAEPTTPSARNKMDVDEKVGNKITKP
jgi:hypothetical protein